MSCKVSLAVSCRFDRPQHASVDVVLSRMILTALLLMFRHALENDYSGAFSDVFLRSQTGHQREDFLDLSVMFLL
jgi:hypothetical protein